MATRVMHSVAVSEGFRCQADAANQFDELVLALKEALGPSSGLTSDDVDVEHLTRLMQQYNCKENSWVRYAMGDESRGYTRNLVDEGNGKSNLVSRSRDQLHAARPEYLTCKGQLVLVWSPGKGSPIHDHGNAHCLMKILRGNLTETRYAFPEGDKEQPMQVSYERTHKENAVAYMADELGTHRVWNQGSDFAVSLHREFAPLPSSRALGQD